MIGIDGFNCMLTGQVACTLMGGRVDVKNIPLVLRGNYGNSYGSGVDSTKCRENKWQDLPNADGKSGYWGGQLPIMILTDRNNKNELPECDRPVDGKQPSGQLLRTGCVQQYVGGGE